MGISILNLPIDIPWKQLAISDDMYANNIVSPLPLKWRSSLAIFSYDPEPDPSEPSNPQERTTFLKVVASITGFQPEGGELDGNVLGSGTYGTQVIENYEELTSAYYPALAALLQVAVYPHGGTWSLAQYPYLTDFEPKKREVVELVSETGEALTQSSTDLNVRKGTTSTDSTENDNIDRGGSFGVSVQSPYGGGVTGSHQQEVGTRSTLTSGTDHVVTTDSSREKRESSHTTNLSQLYHQLDVSWTQIQSASGFSPARAHSARNQRSSSRPFMPRLSTNAVRSCAMDRGSSAAARTASATSRTTGCGSERSADRSLPSESLTQKRGLPPH